MAIANQQSGPTPAKEWELLCRVSELENGEATRIEVGDLKLSASKIKESIYVVSDMCTHANKKVSASPWAKQCMRDACVRKDVAPRHAWVCCNNVWAIQIYTHETDVQG